jgi:hypothetical protein
LLVDVMMHNWSPEADQATSRRRFEPMSIVAMMVPSGLITLGQSRILRPSGDGMGKGSEPAGRLIAPAGVPYHVTASSC